MLIVATACCCIYFLKRSRLQPTQRSATEVTARHWRHPTPACPDDRCRHHPQSRDFSDNPINPKNRDLIIEFIAR